MAVANPFLKALRRQQNFRDSVSEDDSGDFGDTLAEKQPSLFGRVKDATLSGLGVVGNALDLPGSMVRDTLAGENPFDQLLTPFSDENRLSGRDLLRRHGMVGEEDTWGNWAGGLAAEIALDPTTYIGGIGALSKAGKAAKATGLGGKAMLRAAAKKAGRQVGRWEGSMLTTLGDVAQEAGGDAAQRLAAYAKKNPGVRMDEALGGLTGYGVPFTGIEGAIGKGKLAQRVGRGIDKLAAVVGASAPGRFGKMLLNAASGGHFGRAEQELAEGAYEGLENAKFRAAGAELDANEVMRNGFKQWAAEMHPEGFKTADESTAAFKQYDRVVRSVAEGMNPEAAMSEVLGRKVGDVQAIPDDPDGILRAQIWNQVHDLSMGGSRQVSFDDLAAAMPGTNYGKLREEATLLMRRKHLNGSLDNLYPNLAKPLALPKVRVDAMGMPLPPEGMPVSPELIGAIQGVAGNLLESKNSPFRRAVEMGIKVQQLNGSHSPDDLIDEFPEALDNQLSHFPRYGEKKASPFSSKGREYATQGGSTNARNILREVPAVVANRMANDADLRGVGGADKLLEKYAPYIKPPADVDTGEFAQQVVDYLKSRKPGDIYNNDILKDHATYVKNMERMAATGDAIHDYLGANLAPAASDGSTQTLRQAFQNIGMDADNAAAELGRRLGKSAEDVLNMHVKNEAVGAATAILAKVQNPEWFSKAGEVWDAVTHVTKNWLTIPWPSFWARNKAGGIAMNAMSGHIRTAGDVSDYAKSELDAFKLARGGNIPALDAHVFGKQHARVAKEMSDTFGEKANAYMPVMEANARFWAEKTSNPADKYFERFTFKKGSEADVGADALHQWEGEWAGSHGQHTLESVRHNLGLLSKGGDQTAMMGSIKKSLESFGVTNEVLRGNLDDALKAVADGDLSPDDFMGTAHSYLNPDRKLTPEFQQWFGDSAVKGTDGKPLVVFHGATDPSHHINVGKAGNLYGDGTYFTDSPHIASSYAKGKGGVFPAYLSIKKPLDMDAAVDSNLWKPLLDEVGEALPKTNAEAFRRFRDAWIDENPGEHIAEFEDYFRHHAENAGYDGITHLGGNIAGKGKVNHRVFVAWQPEQIKSINNAGSFSNSTDILNQGSKGAVEFKDEKAVITAFKSADISTLAHETGHVFRRTLAEADQNLLKQAEAALNVKDGNWTREAEEQWARGFEKYLATGDAPTSVLKQAFDAFKSWLAKIYEAVVGTPLGEHLNPKLRAVFDAMLSPKARGDVLREVQQYGVIPSVGMDDTALAMGGNRPLNPLRGGEALKRAINKVDETGVKTLRRTRIGLETVSQTGQAMNAQVEWSNRVSMFLYLRRKGWAPEEAAREVKRLHSSIDPTDFERNVMKRLFPFYSFARGTAPVVAKTLATSPGGLMAQAVKHSSSDDRSDVTPDYIAETAAIPLGEQPDGSDRYLTGLGLPHEDTLSFLSAPGNLLRSGGLEALSRLNPLVKGPLEFATGQSFFQKGPSGGRSLDDLDPTVGRLLANVSGQKEAVPTSPLLETVLANSPLSRALTTARTLTDKRKGVGAKALNTLTGVRVTDVSPAAQESVLREAVEKMLREVPESRTYQKTYVSKEAKANMAPEKLATVQKYENILKTLSERAKKRAAARKELAAGR